jgi:predicted HTH domain antitoxin
MIRIEVLKMSTTSMKSIRLTKEEIDLVRILAEQEYLSEAVLLEKLFREGLRNHLKEMAITAYTEGIVSIGEAAEMAKMPYLAFFEELRRRRIVILDESVNLKAELSDLAEKFADEQLAKVAGNM